MNPRNHFIFVVIALALEFITPNFSFLIITNRFLCI